MFEDRDDAARQLAAALAPLGLSHPLVLAIPRGAVPMAAHIAAALRGELDVVLVRKLGAPGNPEFAVGAVDEHGEMLLTPAAARLPDVYLEQARDEALQTLEARRERYTPGRAPSAPAGREVVVVDDGVATGATMVAALRAVARQEPARLVAAVPVGSPDALALIAAEADTVVCLQQPADFYAVGQYYRHFPQVDDAQVQACLQDR